MGSPYPTQTASGYNSSPPSDDGSVTAANKVKWSTIKTQLGDPAKGLGDNINTALRTALNVTPTTQSTNYSTAVTDHLRPIEVTGTTTISLGDAGTMTAQSLGYQVPIINTGTGLVTVNLVTAANTLNGVANGSITLPPWSGAIFSANSTVNGYEIIAVAKPYRQGANIASAATLNLDSASDGDYVQITGTTTVTAITLQKGDQKTVEFAGILTLTNGASLVLPGAANITTAAGDVAVFRGEASGVVRCVAYLAAALKPGSASAGTGLTVTSGALAVSLSLLTNTLGGDVALNNIANFFDGPSVAQGTSGTWFASGTVTMLDASAATYDVKLWDGTTVIASTRVDANPNGVVSASLSGYLATPAANIRISVKDATNATGSIKFNSSGSSKDSTLSVFRVA